MVIDECEQVFILFFCISSQLIFYAELFHGINRFYSFLSNYNPVIL